MNSAEIHLALTHVPVILAIVGALVLATAIIRKNDTLVKTAYCFLLFAGAFTVPVYLTGEGAEEIVEHLPGVSEIIIENHEKIAKLGFGLIIASAALSLIGLIFYRKPKIRNLVWPLVIVLAFITSGIMVVTAHRGGQIRHTEIRSGFVDKSGK